MRRLEAALRAADTFFEITRVVLEELTPLLDIRSFGLDVRARNLAPFAIVTNFMTAEGIAKYTHVYHTDPLPRRIVETRSGASYQEAMSPENFSAVAEKYESELRVRFAAPDIWAFPIAGVGELGGLLRTAGGDWTSRAWRQDADTAASLIALRYAQLGLTPTPDWTMTLTRRQLEIIPFVARGDTNADVGRELGISVNTVKKQLKHLFTVLNVVSRAELVSRTARVIGAIGNPCVLPPGFSHGVHARRGSM